MNTPDKPVVLQHKPGNYQIRVQGHLDPHWSAWFDGLSLSQQDDGTTVMEGPVVDQAALHGLLQKVRSLGLPLVSVIHTETEQPKSPASDSR